MRFKPLPYLPPLLGQKIPFGSNAIGVRMKIISITNRTKINIGLRLLGGKEKSYKNDKRAY